MSQVTSTLQRKLEKAGKCILINSANPQYQVMINQFQHLKGIQMNDIDTKSPLPLHEILGASEYSKIKVQQYSRIGQRGEPITQLTQLGSVINQY